MSASKKLDAPLANDIYLYIVSNRQLYDGPIKATINSLKKKNDEFKYDHALALKAWRNIADLGARQYKDYFKCVDLANVATRNDIAENLRYYYLDQLGTIKYAFGDSFADYTIDGDTLSKQIGVFVFRVTVKHDDNDDYPDKRNDGFWPSHDLNAAGYVEPKKFKTASYRAHAVMDAYSRNQWWYVGLVVEAFLSTPEGEVKIPGATTSLWGLECNYPVFGRQKKGSNRNAYLTRTANELLTELMPVAKDKLKLLVKSIYKVNLV